MSSPAPAGAGAALAPAMRRAERKRTKQQGGDFDRRGRHDRSAVVYRRAGYEIFASEHRAKAEGFTGNEMCPSSCRLGGRCALKLTQEGMTRAHERAFGTGFKTPSAAERLNEEQPWSCKQSMHQRRLLIVEAIASNADGPGYLVDGVAVCRAFCQEAHGITDISWNLTAADLYAGRPVKGLVPETPTPKRPSKKHCHPQPKRILPPSALHQLSTLAADMTAVSVPAAPTTVAVRPTSTAPSFDQMLDALKSAPADALARAVSVLHESALERGMLLMPAELLARRGLSAVNLTTLPSVCSVCEASGQWRSGPFEHCLICCNNCVTVVHQDFLCSRKDQELLQDEGWQCAECADPISRYLAL